AISLGTIIAGCSSSVEQTTAKHHKVASQRSFAFTYQVKVPTPHEGAQSLELFMPVPISTPFQKITDVHIISNLSYTLKKRSRYNTKVVHLVVQNKMPDTVQIQMNFKVERKAILSPKQYTTNAVNPREL